MSETAKLDSALQEHVDTAKCAEHAERYEDMAYHMKEFVIKLSKKNSPNKQLSDEQRNLLSVAYKNVVGTRRTAYRVIETEKATQLSNPEKEGSEYKVKLCEEYTATIVGELNEICKDVIKLLDDCLIEEANKCAQNATPEDEEGKENQYQSVIFYQKMKGDYFRYQVEVETNSEKRKVLSDQSEVAYKEATKVAKAHLDPVHPIRLGLALNFSVFYYEIQDERTQAIALAKTAFEEAIAEMSNEEPQKPDRYKDSSLILQLLRDNLTLWSSSDPEQGDEYQGDEDQLQQQAD